MIADNKVTGRLATGLQFQRLSRYDFVIFTGAGKAPTKLKNLLLRYLWNIEKIFQGFSCDRLSGNQFLFNLTPDVKFISDLDQALIGTSFLLLNFLLVNAVLAKWKPQVMTNTRGLRNWLFEKLSSSRPRDQTPFVSRDNIGLMPYACVMWASLVFTSSSSLLNYNPYSHILGILLLIIFMVVESSSSLRLNYNRLLEPLEEQFLSLRVMTKVQAQRHMASQLLRSLGKEVAMKFLLKFIWLLEPLEKQFLSLGVMTKVQAQRHMDDPAMIEVLGQRSHNEVLAEIYMVRSYINLTLHQLCGIFVKKEGLMALQVAGTFGKAILELGSDDESPSTELCGISFYCVLFSYCHITILHNEFNVVVEHKRISYFLCLAALHVWKTIFFSRLLEPLEKQFLRLGVMTKVQAQRHMDDPAIIQVLGQRSRNEVLAEIYMVRSDINLTLLQLCGISFYCVLCSYCHITILHNEFNVVVEHKRISYFLCWRHCMLLEPLEKQFLSLGVMTKVQAQRHMDDPAIIEVPGQRSHNEVLVEIYMVRSDINLTLHQLCSISFYRVLFSCCHITILHNEFNVVVEHKRISYFLCLAALHVWKTIFFSSTACMEDYLLFKVAGTFGKAILEVGSDDVGPSRGTWMALQLLSSLGKEVTMKLLEPLEKQFLRLGVMTKVQAQRHLYGPAIIEVLGQRSRNEVLAEIYMGLLLCRLLEHLEKQFLSLGVMTKVQAQRHTDDPVIIEVLGQRSRNEVLAEIYMVRSDINLTLNQLCGIFVNKEGLMALQVAGTFGKAILEVGSDDEGIFVNKEGLMTLQVAVTFGKAILELWSDDEGPSTEAHG
ncbi:hypothetical protein ZIOFF_022057 [Zingiber officinale]|uniref:Uncharacterized protein n=1 Tax=Zingiber officinale TaxID=94328 RepID=A0A8J5HCI1_ZINOF|nr:hypothetical protein ZIOFF_022057 [Zingiber officinale]